MRNAVEGEGSSGRRARLFRNKVVYGGRCKGAWGWKTGQGTRPADGRCGGVGERGGGGKDGTVRPKEADAGPR